MKKHPLPESALENHIAILGKTGSGKTYCAKGIVEELLRENERVCIIDPTSAYWGLRSGSTGKGDGFPVVVFGGPKADVPLEKTHGEILAEIVGTSNTPAIIDTRLLTVSDRTRFFADFAEALLRKNKGSLHLVIDEAHLFAPQGRVSDPQSGKMLHAANNLVSLGRGIGLKIIMITQRPAKLHKDSLTQVETLIAMRLVAPQDRTAVNDWIGEWADPKEGKAMLAELPSLPSGEGWIWSPLADVLKRARFPKISTYDSSQAPTGTGGKEPVMAAIDLPGIQERLKSVMPEKAEPVRKASDAELKASFDRGYSNGWDKAIDFIMEAVRKASENKAVVAPSIVKAVPIIASSIPRKETATPKNSVSNLNLSKAERSFLTVLAQHGKLLTRNKIALFAGYSVKSGHIDNTLGGLRSKGFARGGSNSIEITNEGFQALGHYEPLPTGESLRQYWIGEMDKAGAAFLRILFDIYPKTISRDELAERAGYSPTSGHVDNTLGRLRSFDLAVGRSDAIAACDDLF